MLKVEVVLQNPKMAIAILAQGNSLETRVSSPVTIACDRQSVVTCKQRKIHCSIYHYMP